MGQKFDSCNHTPGEVGENFCRHTSSVPARVSRCGDCACPWRAKGVTPADPEAGLPLASKRFERMGIRSAVGGAGSASQMGAGGGYQRQTGIGS